MGNMGNVYFVLEVVLAEVVFIYSYPKRSKFPLRCVLTALCLLAIAYFVPIPSLGDLQMLVMAMRYIVLWGMTVVGMVMFSDLEKGYKPAEDACYIGLASSIIYIVASVVAAIGAFFGLVRKDA